MSRTSGRLAFPILPSGEFVRFPQDDYEEGLYIDYRRFDSLNITPRFKFGFGLTYTTFRLSDMVVTQTAGCNLQPVPRGQILSGGREDLWDVLLTVDVSITNTGKRDGAEVVQLYVHIPAPLRQLRGFEKILVPTGETANVRFSLTRRDLSIWDVVNQEWILERGEYGMYIGSSSRDLPLFAPVTV